VDGVTVEPFHIKCITTSTEDRKERHIRSASVADTLSAKSTRHNAVEHPSYSEHYLDPALVPFASAEHMEYQEPRSETSSRVYLSICSRVRYPPYHSLLARDLTLG
jgi:hypothetical protein